MHFTLLDVGFMKEVLLKDMLSQSGVGKSVTTHNE